MAKNYLYTHTILDERKGRICNINELDSIHLKHRNYVNNCLALAVRHANCGWSDLRYICIKYPGSDDSYP